MHAEGRLLACPRVSETATCAPARAWRSTVCCRTLSADVTWCEESERGHP